MNENKILIITLDNCLYGIELNEKDKKLLWKLFRNNKKMHKSMNITKKFDINIFYMVLEVFNYKYIKCGV